MRLKFSQELILFLQAERDHPLTLADILSESSERSFSLIICLLIFPFLIPMPPGASVLLGTGCLLLAAQMVSGRRTPWLPARITKFQFSTTFIERLTKVLNRASKIIEKVIKPRWARMVNNQHVWKINGLCIAWLSILLMLPIPFTNPIPAVGILLLAIASLESDGLLMFVGYSVVGLNTALFGAIAYLLWQSPEMIQQLRSTIA